MAAKTPEREDWPPEIHGNPSGRPTEEAALEALDEVESSPEKAAHQDQPTQPSDLQTTSQ